MFMSISEAKELVISIGKRMYEKQFVSANDGNITIRVGADMVVATPTGVSKGFLTPDMLLVVNFDGKVMEGKYKPTSEISMHLNIYKSNNEIQSTCHAHSLYMTALACAGLELDMPTTPAAACIVGRVPVAPYACPGSKELAESVIPYVNRYHMVNLANHGPIAWGRTPIEAWYRLESAESAASLAVLLKYTIGKQRPLSKDQLEEAIHFHHADISREALVSGSEVTDNDQVGSLFYGGSY